MNKTATYIANIIFFQGVFKWIGALAIIGIFALGNPKVQAQMAKPEIRSYAIENCEVVGKFMECHK